MKYFLNLFFFLLVPLCEGSTAQLSMPSYFSMHSLETLNVKCDFEHADQLLNISLLHGGIETVATYTRTGRKYKLDRNDLKVCLNTSWKAYTAVSLTFTIPCVSCTDFTWYVCKGYRINEIVRSESKTLKGTDQAQCCLTSEIVRDLVSLTNGNMRICYWEYTENVNINIKIKIRYLPTVNSISKTSMSPITVNQMPTFTCIGTISKDGPYSVKWYRSFIAPSNEIYFAENKIISQNECSRKIESLVAYDVTDDVPITLWCQIENGKSAHLAETFLVEGTGCELKQSTILVVMVSFLASAFHHF